MKKFEIPSFYKSSFISQIKEIRKNKDPRKMDFSPSRLDFGPVEFVLARHFGFCYGVENAIEISYKALQENPGKRIFLLSQMIHNPTVNADLVDRGISFIMDTQGRSITPWEEVKKDDIVIIPAFGTTIEIENHLQQKGIQTEKYNTTCPFVQKVWKMSDKLGSKNYTVVIHGKHRHEETRATFSHANKNARSVIIKDKEEAKILEDFIRGNRGQKEFEEIFKHRFSDGFDVKKDLKKIGVVNQTTMLASETQSIAEYLKSVIVSLHGEEHYKEHFADTRDTLCYATNDNQEATYALLKENADLALVVGGYNSSNTSHLVELCQEKLPTYYISSEENILNHRQIQHFHLENKTILTTESFLPKKDKISIILTSGASCPDAMVDSILDKILSYFPNVKDKQDVIGQL